MTSVMARLVLAILLLPVTGAVFLFLVFAVTRRAGPPQATHLMGVWVGIDIFVATYWLLTWGSVVRWTRRRIVWTIAATLLAPLAGCTFGLLCLSINRLLPMQVIVLAGGGVVPIAWVLATVFIWRETTRERTARLGALGARSVCCPVCGYSMIGLREARCPECGALFTLEQLVASQPQSDAQASDSF